MWASLQSFHMSEVDGNVVSVVVQLPQVHIAALLPAVI
jgi:hypothetical protein